jgi:hypothetical protein
VVQVMVAAVTTGCRDAIESCMVVPARARGMRN